MKTLIPFILLTTISIVINGQALAKVSSGRIKRIENFKSNFVDPRNIDIWLPDNYSASKKYCVVYMNDGQVLFEVQLTGNKPEYKGQQELKVDETFSELIKNKKIKECIVVGIWSNGKFRGSEYIPEKFLPYMEDSFKKTFIRDELQNKPQSDNYLKFIVEELKPYIDSTFSTEKDREHTFIMGVSRGGLISMYAICEYPEIFGGAAGLSSAYIGTMEPNTEITLAAFNYFNKNIPSPKTHRIYNDCGTIELDSLFGVYQKYIDIILMKKGYTKDNYESLVFNNTGHNEKDWAERLNIPTEFLLKK